jgi:hypothetical protein
MSNIIDAGSPRFKARMAGVFYLLTFIFAAAAVGVAGTLFVADNAAATAVNILANETRFWMGFALNLTVIGCYVAVTALFYDLFKPVNRAVSLCALLTSLVACAVQAGSFGFYAAPLGIVRGSAYLPAFTPGQLENLALLSLRVYAQIYNIGIAFFGLYCLLIGCLIVRSGFLPRILGVLMLLGGLGWLTFLFPPLAHALSPYILAPGILGEGALTLWLIVFGVKITQCGRIAEGEFSNNNS